MKAKLALAAFLLTGSSTVLAQGTEANWNAVVSCANSATATARHACIDQVLRAAGVLDPAREVAQQRADFGRTERPDPAPVPVPSAPAPATAPASPAPSPSPASPGPQRAERAPERVDGIATTIAAARLAGNGRLLVATAEATVWRQVDGETFRIAPSPGTRFEVERGALGSFVCKVGRSKSFRCTRVD